MNFGWINNRKVDVNFNGGHIPSDSRMLLLRKIYNKLGLIKISNVIKDNRIEGKCKHQIESMIKQEYLVIVYGYEDLNYYNLSIN